MKKIIVALLTLVLVASFSIGTASAANSLQEGSKGISIGFIDTNRTTSFSEDRIYTIYGKYFTSRDFALLAGFGFLTSSGDGAIQDEDYLNLAFGVRKYLSVDDFAPFIEGLISLEKYEQGPGVDDEWLNFIVGFGGEYFFARQFSMEGTIGFIFGTYENNNTGDDATFFGTASLGLRANFYF